MKKIISSSGLLLVLMVLLLSAPSANAKKCDKSIDIFCTMFERMATQVKLVKNIDQLDNLDFDRVISDLDVESVPEECLYTKLSKNDKIRLQKSVDTFADAVADKIYTLAGGALSLADCRSQMQPVKSAMTRCLNNSVTLQDLINNINYIF